MTEALQERIEALETRVAFQDQTIEDLNAAVVDQWKHIDTLMHEVKRLRDLVEDTRASMSDPKAPEPPPPHY